ncbi:ethionine resistance protein [Kickxella alabastrina]|nr:ethionine resistance protein [Kickxella alabastrina]
MFMIAFSSIGVAALNRAGNLIGHRSVRGAKISSTVSLCLGLIFAFLGALAILWSPETWIRIFTNDEQTVQGAKEVLPVAIFGFAAQSLAFVCSQLLSAQGKQALAMRIKFVMLYVVGLPLGYYWAIVSGHGLVGLWSAVAVGQTCTALVEAVVMLKTDWVRLVDYCTETIIMP